MHFILPIVSTEILYIFCIGRYLKEITQKKGSVKTIIIDLNDSAYQYWYNVLFYSAAIWKHQSALLTTYNKLGDNLFNCNYRLFKHYFPKCCFQWYSSNKTVHFYLLFLIPIIIITIIHIWHILPALNFLMSKISYA